MSDPAVRQELMGGWRDPELSARHRMWGFDLPAVDIDFLLLSYDHSKPVALIDYTTGYRDVSHPNFEALRSLASSARIPAFLVYHERHKTDWFHVKALNPEALNVLKQQQCLLSEADYVAFLYKMTAREIPKDIAERLKGE